MKQSKKTIQARHQKILDLIYENGEITIEELCQDSGMSTLTIRRDLEILSQKKLLERFRGGARMIDGKTNLDFFTEKEQIANKEKKLIANYIARLIPDETTIFCNSGTTVLEVINLIRNKRVTIITNNALAFSNMENSQCEILCTGGVYDDRTKSFAGEFATTIIQKTFVDMCILGANGISAEYGVTTAYSGEPMVNQLMVKRCKGKRVIAASGNKLGKIYCFTSLSLDEIDLLVTDSSADMEELIKIQDQGVEVVIVDENNASFKSIKEFSLENPGNLQSFS